MPLKINGEDYYQTAEACRLAGTTRNTFLRWLKNGSYMDVGFRDRRGWRLFSEQELADLKTEVNRIISTTGKPSTSPGELKEVKHASSN